MFSPPKDPQLAYLDALESHKWRTKALGVHNVHNRMSLDVCKHLPGHYDHPVRRHPQQSPAVPGILHLLFYREELLTDCFCLSESCRSHCLCCVVSCKHGAVQWAGRTSQHGFIPSTAASVLRPLKERCPHLRFDASLGFVCLWIST